MKYRLESWKLRVEGEYLTEEEAIKDMADKYMRCSKCDMPGQHPAELLTGSKMRQKLRKIGKGVVLSVWESVYGREQWVEKYSLTIYPFKSEHWWPTEGRKLPKPYLFRYKINKPEKEK